MKTKNELFIEKAKLVHRDKYNYSQVNYEKINVKVKIICPIHGEFQQTPHHHVTRKQGCGKCRYINISKITRSTKEEFISKAKLVHGNKYDYSSVEYVNRKTKVKIICKKHGIFEQEPHNHIRGQTCGKCFGLYKTNNDFIKEAKEMHGDKYDYSLVKYVNRKTKVKIICPEHGIFEQLSYAHVMMKQGCPKCVGLYKTNDDFIKDAKKVHDNTYDYSLINYSSSKEKLKIICKKHGVFEQTPNMHLRGQGCPICKESNGEREIRLFLIENKIKFIRQYKFSDCVNDKKLPFDFYLPAFNLCIEYDGVQHFKSIETFGGDKGLLRTKQNDYIKTKYCQNKNILLLRVPFNKKVIPLLKAYLLKNNILE